MIIDKNIDTRSDKRQLLATYIGILTDDFTVSLSRHELLELIKTEFNYTTTLNDISEYFEPSVEEFERDLRQQMKNLGIRYE
jgi:hypothetical protein